MPLPLLTPAEVKDLTRIYAKSRYASLLSTRGRIGLRVAGYSPRMWCVYILALSRDPYVAVTSPDLDLICAVYNNLYESE